MANAAEHARSRVAVSDDVAGGSLLIGVADDGPGFSLPPPSNAAASASSQTTHPAPRATEATTGLGLHAASEARRANGGRLARQQPSGGAVATITIPWRVLTASGTPRAICDAGSLAHAAPGHVAEPGAEDAAHLGLGVDADVALLQSGGIHAFMIARAGAGCRVATYERASRLKARHAWKAVRSGSG